MAPRPPLPRQPQTRARQPKASAKNARHTGLGRICDGVRAAVTFWALVGGVCLGAIVLVNVATVVLSVLGIGFAGDFELTELLAAVAVMAFLPLAQLSGAHVAAEIFTQRAGPRYRAAATVVAGAVGAALAAVLGWRMAAGMIDQRGFGAETAILGIPIWWAYAPGLVSLGLWATAALVTMAEALAPRAAATSAMARDV